MGTIISKSKMNKKDPLEVMRFVFCADRAAFVSFFENLGLAVQSEDDLKLLAKWHNEGRDTRGEIVNNKKQNLKFDILNSVYSIRLNHNKVINCGINYVD